MDNYEEFGSIMTEQSFPKPEQTFYTKIIKKRPVNIKPPRTINSRIIQRSHTNNENLNNFLPPRRCSNNSMIYQNNNIYINPICIHCKKVSNGNTNFHSLYNNNSLSFVKKNIQPSLKYKRIDYNGNTKKFLPVRNYQFQYNKLKDNSYRLTENSSFYEVKQTNNTRQIHSFYQKNNSFNKIELKKNVSPKKNEPRCILPYKNSNNALSSSYSSSTPSIRQNKKHNNLLRQKKYIVFDDNNDEEDYKRSFNNYVSTYNDDNFEDYKIDYSNYNFKVVGKNRSYNDLDKINFGICSIKNYNAKEKFNNDVFNTKKNKSNISNDLIEPNFYCNLDNLKRNSNLNQNHNYHETNESNRNKPHEIINKDLTNKIKLNNNFTLKNINKIKLTKIPKIRANDLIKKLNISKEKLNKIKNLNKLVNVKNDNHSYYEIKNIKNKENEKINTINENENKAKGFIMNDDIYVKYFPYVSKSPYKFYKKRGINNKKKNKISYYVYTEKNGDIKIKDNKKKFHTKKNSTNVVYHEIEDFKKALKKGNSTERIEVKKTIV